MAKVNVEFDTVTKNLVVTMDGVAVDNVQNVSIHKPCRYDDGESDDTYGCCLYTLQKDDAHDYRTMTQIVAKETTEGKKAALLGAGTSKFSPEFLALTDVKSSLKEEIAKLMSERRKRCQIS